MVEDSYHVLIVEDETGVANLYRTWVFDAWTTEVAGTVTEALSALDDGVDMIVLDRHLPDGSGDEVLDALDHLAYDPLILAVTAIEPDFDIVGLAVDDYLVKPLSRETFRDSLQRLAHRITYTAELRELYALASKKAVLEARKPSAELAESDAYADLAARVESKRDQADEVLDRVAADGYRPVFRGLFKRRPSAVTD